LDAMPLASGPLGDVLGSANPNNTKQLFKSYAGWEFPVISKDMKTTVIHVAFPVTEAHNYLAETGEHIAVVAVFVVALIVFMLPMLSMRWRGMPRLCRKWISRNMALFFAIAFLFNFVIIFLVVATVPHVDLEMILVGFINVYAAVVGGIKIFLSQVLTVVIILLVWLYRKNIMQLLGKEQSFVRCDIRDLLTCFSMHRFGVVEFSVFRVDGLPSSQINRALYVEVQCGYNEAQVTRVHEDRSKSIVLRDSMQLNFDDEDDTQHVSIIVKEQEVLGTAITQLAPAAGALAGLFAGVVTPITGGVPGALVGGAAGVGVASSVGREIARVDFSCASINMIMEKSAAKKDWADVRTAHMATGGASRWKDSNFVKVDLTPHGFAWIRVDALDIV